MSKRINLNDYPIHPAAELFPMMSEAEFQEMKEDIRINGQSDPVLMWNGQLLDGRNRLRACTELGIEPSWIELELSLDPVVWVLSHNLHRRHLTTAQRAMVADKLAILQHGESGNGRKVDALIKASTQEDAAKKLNVSRSSVQKARKVRKKASKKVVEAVERGEMSLNAALATTKAKEEREAKEAEREARKKAREAEKAAARVAREAERAAAKAAREKAKAEEKAAKAKAKEEAKAAKTAELPVGEQAKLVRNMVQQLIDKAVRGIDDLHRLKPNQAVRVTAIKALQGIKLW